MRVLPTILVAFASGVAGAWAFSFVSDSHQHTDLPFQASAVSEFKPGDHFQSSSSAAPLADNADPTGFNLAATKATPSVVYINSISQSGGSSSMWDFLMGNGGPQTQVSSGSGVIFTADGYIVTNNHVVQAAEKIEVIYNKKEYDAELIGTDPSTDLAVLKIKETNLPAITLGSSKNLQVGEWVVAVGNPFSLSSTVTAGIVSAKGRRINIVEDKFPIESFIQTDAAINPGNSGGALVNRNGDLVGINTAILSRTGSYTGYAFAIPVDIAKKVVHDLIQYGIVQKAIIGGSTVDYDFQNATKYGLTTDIKNYNGVLLLDVYEKSGVISAAKSAGLQQGDIITKVNTTEVNSESEFEEELSYRSPGDKINITFIRQGKEKTVTLTLLNKNGDSGLITRKLYTDARVGATLEEVDMGIKVTKINEGLFRQLGIPENFTIVAINRKRVKEPQDVIDFFNSYKGQVLLYGVTSSKEQMQVPFMLR